MENTVWAVEGQPDAVVEVNNRRYAAQDGGAPQLCSSLCRNQGRHVHVAFCQTEKGQDCQGAEHEHIQQRMVPDPDREKDWVSHRAFWARSGTSLPQQQVH